jgi:hypothetical protein
MVNQKRFGELSAIKIERESLINIYRDRTYADSVRNDHVVCYTVMGERRRGEVIYHSRPAHIANLAKFHSSNFSKISNNPEVRMDLNFLLEVKIGRS